MSSLDDSWDGFLKHKNPNFGKEKEEAHAQEIQKRSVQREEAAAAAPGAAAAPAPAAEAVKSVPAAAAAPGMVPVGPVFAGPPSNTARCPFCNCAMIEATEKCSCGAFVVPTETKKKRKSTKGSKERKASKEKK